MSTAPIVAVDARMAGHSGIGTYLRNILVRLLKQKPEWQFTLLGDSERLAALVAPGMPNAAVTRFSAPIYGISEQLWWLAHAPRADLLWVPHYNVPLFPRARLAVTVHDMVHLAVPEFAANWRKRLYAGLMMRTVRTRASGIVFVSEFTRGEFRRLSGAPVGRQQVIGEGVDAAWFAAEAPREAAGPPTVVFVGNVKPHKNLPRLLGAFAYIRQEVPHRLVLIGKREGFLTGDDTVAPLAEALGDRVELRGQVSDEELRRTVAGADLLVLPSLYEGFGLPALEAMACGCPVLCARAASLPEVCGDAAAYCDPLSETDIVTKLLALLRDPALRARLSAAGRERAKAFDWDKAAAQTAAFFTSLLAESVSHA